MTETSLTPKKLKNFQRLPNHDGMISMLLGMFQSPIRSFAYALCHKWQNNVRKPKELLLKKQIEAVAEEATEEVAGEAVVEETTEA
ncbi:hypothetical protein MGH68_03300 [Erysipelothrix sp. D19-032]